MYSELLKVWLTVFAEGDGDGGQGGDKGGDNDGGDKGGDKGGGNGKEGKGKVFTQEEVNRILAEDKRKHQTTLQKTLDELNLVKSKANLTDTERHELDSRIETLQNTLKTKEELAKSEIEKLTKKHGKVVDDLTLDRDSWKSKYTDSTIVRSITDAAVVTEAFSPEQIVAILKPKTQLAEALDEDGKPTGNLVPKVSFDTKDKDGKTVTLNLSPSDAVKKMSEEERYFNLFKGKGAGGLGGTNKGKVGEGDIKKLAQDPSAYRKARAEGKLPHQKGI
jgi:hypothetical protein